jgi:hypothetical protein
LVEIDLSVEAAGACDDGEELVVLLGGDLVGAGEVAAAARTKKLIRRERS